MTTATSQGRKFNFPDGTTPEQMGIAIEKFFSTQQPAQPVEQAIPAEVDGVPFKQRGILDPLLALAEPALTIASGIVAEPIAGIAGIGALLPGGRTPAEAIEATRGALTFEPRTEAGQAGLQRIGEGAQAAADVISQSAGGLTGLAKLATTGDLSKAVESSQRIQDIGITKALGEAGAEIAGPVGGAIGEALPTAIGAVTGVRAIPQSSILKAPSAINTKIAELIEQGSADIITARFKKAEAPNGLNALPRQQTVLEKALNIGAPKIVKDKAATAAIRQGFDEGVIAAIKGSSKPDKRSMLKMTNILESGKKNARFAVTNRPTDVVGDALLKRLNIVRSANKLAGKNIDKVARSLKGKSVESGHVANRFSKNLHNMGVKLSVDSKGVVVPLFKGSDIEGLSGPESAIKRVIKRMASGDGVPDAFDLHRLKRFIDEQVSFGKSAEGLTGKTENILKTLRFDIDGVLDTNFPAYDKVNTIYSDTIGAIDAFQKSAGGSINLSVDSSNKAIGTVLRRILGNTQSRLNLLDSIDEIERAARKYGSGDKLLLKGLSLKGPKDDLLTLILFADELDSVFGATARTSFKGQIDQAIRTGARAAASPTEAGVGVIGSIAEKISGVSEGKAIEAIKKLLRESANGDNIFPINGAKVAR